MKPNEIIESIKKAFTEEEISQISGISPFLESTNCNIKFKKLETYKSAINKEILIRDTPHKVVDVL